jgi:polar amino acid transport system substrate-binding protein
MIVVHLACWLGALAPQSVAAAEPCALRVGWEPYAPYTFAGEDGQVTGIDVDLLNAIAEAIGCTVGFTQMPWARIIREVETGTLDIATSTSWTPERAEWGLLSMPYRETEIAIYVRGEDEGRFDLGGLVDVPAQGLKLGVIVDYFYGDELERLTEDPAYAMWIDGAPDYATNIRKLLNGRIDGVLAEDVGVMQTELQRLGAADSVVRHPLPLPGEELHFLFSRATVDPALVAQVDAAITRLKADGRLDAIVARYL